MDPVFEAKQYEFYPEKNNYTEKSLNTSFSLE